jgi:hypothetical protein
MAMAVFCCPSCDSDYEQNQEMGAAVCYSVIMYVNYDVTAEDGTEMVAVTNKNRKWQQSIAMKIMLK